MCHTNMSQWLKISAQGPESASSFAFSGGTMAKKPAAGRAGVSDIVADSSGMSLDEKIALFKEKHMACEQDINPDSLKTVFDLDDIKKLYGRYKSSINKANATTKTLAQQAVTGTKGREDDVFNLTLGVHQIVFFFLDHDRIWIRMRSGMNDERTESHNMFGRVLSISCFHSSPCTHACV